MLYRNNRNFPVHTFLLLPPFRRQERLYQRRSVRLPVRIKTTFEENAEKTLLYSNKDYAIEVTLITFWKKTLLEVNFSERLSAIQNKQTTRKVILPLLTEYRPSAPNLKTILMIKWHLIENQPMPREIYKDPPLLSYRKGRSLKVERVRAKLIVIIFLSRPIARSRVWPVIIILHSVICRGKAVNPRDFPVVTVRDFTKFCIPPPLFFELEKSREISPTQGQRI